MNVRRVSLAVFLVASVGVASCAPAMPLRGPHDGDIDQASDAHLEATFTGCVGRPWDLPFQVTGEMTLRGDSMGGRVGMRLWLAADFDNGWLRLEPVEASPTFVFIATGLGRNQGDWSDVDGSVIDHGGQKPVQQAESRELLQRLLGLPLSADDLFSVLLGCPFFPGSITGHWLGPNEMRVLMGDMRVGEMFLRRVDARSRWTLTALGVSIPGRPYQWRADYGGRFRAPFRHFRVRSQEWNGVMGRTFDLRFSWNRIEFAATLDEQLFEPSAATPRSVS